MKHEFVQSDECEAMRDHLPCPSLRALYAGRMTTEAYVRHLPCAACATIGQDPPSVPQEPRSGPGLADVAREVGALEERIQGEVDAERAAHDAGLAERIAAELARAWRDEPARAGASARAGNVVPDEGMRGRAWRRP